MVRKFGSNLKPENAKACGHIANALELEARALRQLQKAMQKMGDAGSSSESTEVENSEPETANSDAGDDNDRFEGL